MRFLEQPFFPPLTAPIIASILALFLAACSENLGTPNLAPANSDRVGYDKQAGTFTSQAATTTDLTTLSATDLANALVGTGVTVTSVSYTGDSVAAGTFEYTGADDVLGFGNGIVLTSGRIVDAAGPNVSDSTTYNNLGGSDSDLASLVPGTTLYNASVLTIEFVPTGDEIFFEYVFGSEEYNEWVGSSYNDVFGFFVNGTNEALVNGVPVTVNNVNLGSNSAFYRNNDPSDFSGAPPINIEMDGLTTVLVLNATVTPNVTNTLKLAIADTSDAAFDSYVFIRGETFSTEPPPSLNQPPEPSVDESYAGDEGSTIGLSGSASDADADALTYSWSVAPAPSGTGTCTITDTDDTDADASVVCTDDGTYTVTLTVDDGTVQASADADLIVSNAAPLIGGISVDADLVAVGTSVAATAAFTDPGTGDIHTATWNWGDGNSDLGTVTQGAGDGSVADNHTYTVPGVYTVGLTVTDDDGASDTATYEYVVIYDPDGGFVTGGGWIDSPAGAYVPDPALTGRANFGFVSKYKKGADLPTGNTEFQFQAGDLAFHSSSYEWLVVNQGGQNAQFRGFGTINGEDGYRFMLWAGDDTPDTFRIRIWTEDADGNETVHYDNGTNQPIGGGSIVIHTKKN